LDDEWKEMKQILEEIEALKRTNTDIPTILIEKFDEEVKRRLSRFRDSRGTIIDISIKMCQWKQIKRQQVKILLELLKKLGISSRLINKLKEKIKEERLLIL